MERNVTLDYFKIFLSILVVTIHTQPLLFTGSLGGWLISNGLARIAVPCFFIINGYYLHSKTGSNKSFFNWMKRLIIIYITWTLIYLPLTLYSGIFSTIISLTSGIFHLWYLTALIVGGIILFLAKKVVNNNSILLIVAIILFFIGLYIQDNIFSISDEHYRMHLYRNALFMCFPFLFIGYYIKENKEKILKIKSYVLLIVIATGLIAVLYEASYFFHNYYTRKDFLAGIILVAPALFLLILKHSRFKVDDAYIGLIASGIFYSHVLAIYIASEIFPLEELRIYTLPLILFLSMVLSAVTIQLNKRIKIFL